MFLSDCHTHTRCSPDSTAALEDMVKAAAKSGLSWLCTTDHCDLLGENGEKRLDWDWNPILEQYGSLENPGGLTVRLGLELGSGPFFPETARQIVTGAPLDFVIASVHNMTPDRGGEDIFYFSFAALEECYAVLDDYFAGLEAAAEMDPELWDVLGHIIYPLRYINGRAGHNVTLEPYRDRLDRILGKVIAAGKGIEINTHCGGETAQWTPILQRYRELGGRLVTIGSDAHRPEDVGKGAAEAVQLLRRTGFTHTAVYTRRKPELVPV